VNLDTTLKAIGGAILAVATFLQLESGLSHVLHIVLACVVVFLSYLLGVKTEVKSPTFEENKFEGSA
jgi:chromate transport protein ChrA